MRAVMGLTRRSNPAVSANERAVKRVMEFPVAAEARARFPPPTACAMETVVPMARPTSMTVSMCMTCEPMETAVVAATPSYWPMINRSAMP